MRTHITVFAWLQIVLGGFNVLIGLAWWLVLALAGGAAAAAGRHEFAMLGGLLAFSGTLIFLLVAVVGLPGVVVGWGLLNRAPWARIGGIVLAILNLPNFPVGTAMGIYGLIVLFNRETVAMFEGGSAAML